MTHTPGPWDVAWIVTKGGRGLGLVVDGDFTEFTHEDADLIAAAPDLLQVAQTLLLRLDLQAEETDENFPGRALRAHLREAVEKAEGRR